MDALQLQKKAEAAKAPKKGNQSQKSQDVPPTKPQYRQSHIGDIISALQQVNSSRQSCVTEVSKFLGCSSLKERVNAVDATLEGSLTKLIDAILDDYDKALVAIRGEGQTSKWRPCWHHRSQNAGRFDDSSSAGSIYQ